MATLFPNPIQPPPSWNPVRTLLETFVDHVMIRTVLEPTGPVSLGQTLAVVAHVHRPVNRGFETRGLIVVYRILSAESGPLKIWVSLTHEPPKRHAEDAIQGGAFEEGKGRLVVESRPWSTGEASHCAGLHRSESVVLEERRHLDAEGLGDLMEFQNCNVANAAFEAVGVGTVANVNIC